jgi:hypothetical protein
MVAFNDFYQCHEPPPSGDAHGIARLPIPVFRNLFFGPKKTVPDRIPEDFFFSCVFRRKFSQERGFGGIAGIPVLFSLLQEFFAGIPEFTSDSSGIRRIPPDSCSHQLLSG